MWKRFLILFLSIFFLTNCKHESRSSHTFFIQIKKLTYSRDSNPQKWQKLFNNLHSSDAQYQFVLSAGQTKLKTLYPLLKSIFTNAQDDSLRLLSIFAMAQTDPEKSSLFFMNRLSEDSLNLTLQKAMIRALGFAGNLQSGRFLENFVQKNALRDDAYFALGLLAKQGFTDTTFLNQQFDSTRTMPPTAAEAYFLYSSPLKFKQLERFLNWLSQANPKSKTFILKKLVKTLSGSKTPLFLADSSNQELLRSFLIQELTKNENSWHVLLPELDLTRNFPDSLFYQLVQKHISDSLPSLRIHAFAALAAIDPQNALPLLVNHFTELPYTYEKAYLCQLIAKIDAKTGYMLINQNLDKGNSYFKKELLSALAETKFPLAFNMLHRFLQVDDPILIEGAYNALKRAHQLRNNDVQNLLANKYYSVVALILSDLNSKDTFLQKEMLLNLFKKFHRADQFELQLEIASLLKKHGGLTQTEKDTIRKYLAHPFVAQKIFRKLDIKYQHKPYKLKLLPPYLRPDSLEKGGHPMVAIKTSKGLFKMELFPEYAPLTVKNFLHLAKIKFYDHLYFHRVVDDFVVQGGDPSGTGWGGTNYLIPSEHSPLSFVRGVVGIATAGFDTGSSQFFICLSDQPHLDGHYTAFAKVVKGMNVVDKLEQGDFILKIERIR